MTESEATARASEVVQLIQQEFLADPQGLDLAQIRAFFERIGQMLQARIARGLLARAAQQAQFPPAPPTVPVMITVENNGAGRATSTPRHLNTYRLGNSLGVEQLLRSHGWIIDTVGPTHIYAAAPDNRRLGREHVHLQGTAPTEQAFLAWAEQVHAFFTHHPERLRNHRYEDPAGNWIYWGAHEWKNASLSWDGSGGQLRVTWRPGTPPELERQRISYEMPQAGPAADPTQTTGGVRVTRVGGMLYVESPKLESFRRWARMTGGSWIRSFGDNGAWRFAGDTEEAVRRRLRRDYGTDGASVPAVSLRLRWTQAYVRDFVVAGNTWEEAYLNRPILTKTRRGYGLDVGVRLVSGRLSGLSLPQDAVLEVQGVAQPLAARLMQDYPDTFFLDQPPPPAEDDSHPGHPRWREYHDAAGRAARLASFASDLFPRPGEKERAAQAHLEAAELAREMGDAGLERFHRAEAQKFSPGAMT